MRLGAAGLLLVGGGAALVPGCGSDGGCPEATEELSSVEVDLYRQLEVCASRVTGVELHRDDLPRLASDPELVECSQGSGRCVETPAGEAVLGFYLEACDTFTVADPSALYHEMVHAILCDLPEGDCDPSHASPVWQQCQTIKGCPEGRLILEEKVCDGTDDCEGGADEAGCG
jgi:hypothetical protein